MTCRLCAVILVVICFSIPVPTHAYYPEDPISDTAWPQSSESGVADIQMRFNTARASENTQLGTSIPMLAMPTQSEWNAKAQGEKALWLINRERVDRGVAPLHGVEDNVAQVARAYAQFLLDHDAFAHNADGKSPSIRLNDNPAIGACHDFLSRSENLAVLWGGWTLPVERSVYMWIYDDSSSNWGHRQAILWFPYNDNSGAVGKEGFLGIGVASGPHQGWPDADIIVMNVFDPCATWSYDQSQFELSVIMSGPPGGAVQSSPGGIDCGEDCSQTYDTGQVVTLTASNDACTDFSGWSGGGCGSNPSCTVTLQEHISVTASFVARDSDADQIPDCQEPDPDDPDDPEDSGDTVGDTQGETPGDTSVTAGTDQATTTDSSRGSSGGCFINSMR